MPVSELEKKPDSTIRKNSTESRSVVELSFNSGSVQVREMGWFSDAA